jgi:N-acyl-D-amino-acid deacylase
MPEGDLTVRDGLIVDGTGAAPFHGDVEIRAGRIASVRATDGGAAAVTAGGAAGSGEIDATGCVVTPGFVDIHTHYDGQAIWSDHLTPSALHGVSTVVAGNCGVGFAPCRPADHALLVNAMEGVEDIPEVVMTDGLPWTWETFGQFLDAVAARRHDVDVAAYLPHSPLRVYAMGERGAGREAATSRDLDLMASLVGEAMAAGAVGVSSSRLEIHRRGDGEHIPSFRAAERELVALAAAMDGQGILQIVTNVTAEREEEARRHEIEMLERVACAAGVQVTFSLTQGNATPEVYRQVLDWVDEANSRSGMMLHTQFAPRPIGVHLGFDLSVNPFAACPSYQELAGLAPAQRIAELRKPDVRARLLGENPQGDVLPIVRMARQFAQTFVITDPPTYEPGRELSVASLAAEAGVTAAEMAYDLLLADDGHAMLYVALSNFGAGNLDHVADTFSRPGSVIGLGDGGAHYGMICDSGYPTWVLTHWVRNRERGRLSLARAVQALAADTAAMVGLRDRGTIEPGLKGDLNVIDLDRLRLNVPEVRYDLPAGGRRLNQTARGYRWTVISGQPVVRDDAFTGALPGHLVRGQRQRPAA